MWKIIAAIQITMIVTVAVCDVGKPVNQTYEIVPWHFPIAIGGVLGQFMLLGYMIGKGK